LIESYYCLDGTIYPCPNLGTVLSSRLSTSLYFLQDMLAKYEIFKSKDKISRSTRDLSSVYNDWLSLEYSERAKINQYISYFDHSLATE
jgi:MED6 mediator sub complex component